MVHRSLIPFTAMTGPPPSARADADPRTMRLALELLERTAGRRRRCRRCRSAIAENARKRGQAWSVCTSCAQAIEDEIRQIEIAPALIRQCLVCRTDIAHLRAGARSHSRLRAKMVPIGRIGQRQLFVPANLIVVDQPNFRVRMR